MLLVMPTEPITALFEEREYQFTETCMKICQYVSLLSAVFVSVKVSLFPAIRGLPWMWHVKKAM